MRRYVLAWAACVAVAMSGCTDEQASSPDTSSTTPETTEVVLAPLPTPEHFRPIADATCMIEYDGLIELQVKSFEAELSDAATDECVALAATGYPTSDGSGDELRFAAVTTSAAVVGEIATRHGRSSPIGPSYGDADVAMLVVRSPERTLCCGRGPGSEERRYDTKIHWYSRTEGVGGMGMSLTSSVDPMTIDLVELTEPQG